MEGKREAFGQLQTPEGGAARKGRVRSSGTSGRKHVVKAFWFQPHFMLNLLSVVFFTLGCLMMIMSRRQDSAQVIMKYPADHHNVALSMVINDKVPAVTEDHSVKRTSLPRSSVASVEYESFGNIVPLADALLLAEPRPVREAIQAQKAEEDLGDVAIKLFVGVVSTCGNELNQQRRQKIRETWKSYSLEKFSNVDIKFFLSQPSNDSLPAAVSMLRDEAAEQDDLVVIKGLDIYNNLPQKTVGLLRYFISLPTAFTHILKTDDDCYVRIHKVFESLKYTDGSYMMENVYMGCLENRAGFQPIRDPKSKWYIPLDVLPDNRAREIFNAKYLAGWGYVMSRDVVKHALSKVDMWDTKKEPAPFWYNVVNWEDVIMGLLVSEKVGPPQEAVGYKAAWRACTNQTAVRHLDLDAPRLFQGLHEQEVSGLWDQKTVQCSGGQFLAGDYNGWKAWRNSVVPDNQRV